MTSFILLAYQINYNISPWILNIVWPFMLAVQATVALRGRDKMCIIARPLERMMVWVY